MNRHSTEPVRHAVNSSGIVEAAAHSRMRLSAAFAIILSVMIVTILVLACLPVTTKIGFINRSASPIMQLTFFVGAIEVLMTIFYIRIVNRLETQAAAEGASH